MRFISVSWVYFEWEILLDVFWDVFTSPWIWWSASGLEPLGSLWRHLRRRPHQAEQDRQGALHSKFVGIKIALPKKSFWSFTWLDWWIPKNTSKVSASYGGAILRIRFHKVAWFSCKRGFVRFQQLALTKRAVQSRCVSTIFYRFGVWKSGGEQDLRQWRLPSGLCAQWMGSFPQFPHKLDQNHHHPHCNHQASSSSSIIPFCSASDGCLRGEWSPCDRSCKTESDLGIRGLGRVWSINHDVMNRWWIDDDIVLSIFMSCLWSNSFWMKAWWQENVSAA